MLRLIWRTGTVPPRVLKEDEFIHELEEMAAQAFVGAPPGSVSVEGLDERLRVTWRAHYKSAAELSTLLRQLLAERDIAARAAGRSPCSDTQKGVR